ncbi:MAG: Hsp33 family molecular chaperone HslO [Gammaproteobacteria bacterium]|nr:Hsp33 family molecular chaperone HslO [Gammaproteobacteria bacterium]
MGNVVQKFLLSDLDIRGAFVHLDTEWQEVLSRRSYASSIVELLGQTTAATLLMSSHIKFDGRLNVQVQSNGDLSLLIVQSDNKQNFRSFAKYKGLLGGDLTKVAKDGILIISIETRVGDEPYQGLVSLDSDSVAENIELYFNQSEQLQTILVLRADGQQVAGLLLQALPDTSAEKDDWERLRHVAETLNLEELKTIDSETLIGRVFAEDDVVAYPAEPAKFDCTCSDERTLAMLSSLSIEELTEIAESEETIDVSCDFCGKQYAHDSDTVSALVANKIHPN